MLRRNPAPPAAVAVTERDMSADGASRAFRLWTERTNVNAPTNITASRASAGAVSFLAKLRGRNAALPPRATTTQVALAGLGGGLAIGLVGGLAAASGHPLVLGSFGAS